MQNETMTDSEAWAVVERLKINVSYSHDKDDWYALTLKPEVQVAFGPSPIAAIETLLVKLAQCKMLEQRIADAIEHAEPTLNMAESAANN